MPIVVFGVGVSMSMYVDPDVRLNGTALAEPLLGAARGVPARLLDGCCVGLLSRMRPCGGR